MKKSKRTEDNSECEGDKETMPSGEDRQADADWERVLSKYKNAIDCGEVHFAPEIPKKILERAITTYAADISAEDVLVLIDDAPFISGSKGMVITRTHIYWYQGLKDCVSVRLSDIASVEYKDSTSMGERICVNGGVVLEFFSIERRGVSLLAEMILGMSQIGRPLFRKAVVEKAEGTDPSVAEGNDVIRARWAESRSEDVESHAQDAGGKEKKKYQKAWFVPLGKLSIFLVGPSSIAMAILAIYLGIPFSGGMFMQSALLLLGALLAFTMGRGAAKGEAVEEDDILGVCMSWGILVIVGYFVLSVAIPWFGREGLLAKASSSNARLRVKVAKDFGNILSNSNLKDDRIVSTLLELSSDSEKEVRIEAIESLGCTDDGKVVYRAMQMLEDSDGEVRLEAARVLGRIKDPNSYSALVEVASSDPSSDVREKAKWASEEIPVPEAESKDTSLGELGFWKGFSDGILSPVRFINMLVVRGDSYVWTPGIRTDSYLWGRTLGCILAIWIVGIISSFMKKK